MALIVTWDAFDPGAALSATGYLIRGIAFVLLGVLLGAFVDERRTLEAHISTYFTSSLDLLATIDLSGRLTHVNPAWERTLGYRTEEMLFHPISEFVHPDELEATAAEQSALSSGSHETIGFRNRWRAADGSY